MKALNTRTIVGYGLLTWFTPFFVSFLFMTPEGVPRIDILFFKKIMLLTGAAVGTALMVRAFRRSELPGRQLARRIGGIWLGINLLLDIIILLPISGMSLIDWVTGIAIGYFSIPIVAIGMGLVADDGRARNLG